MKTTIFLLWICTGVLSAFGQTNTVQTVTVEHIDYTTHFAAGVGVGMAMAVAAVLMRAAAKLFGANWS
jgi:hypothetical protein